MKNNNKNNKIHEFNILYFNIQLIMTILTTVIFVLYLFNKNYKTVLQLCFSFTLLSVGINEFVIYHKKEYGMVDDRYFFNNTYIHYFKNGRCNVDGRSILL